MCGRGYATVGLQWVGLQCRTSPTPPKSASGRLGKCKFALPAPPGSGSGVMRAARKREPHRALFASPVSLKAVLWKAHDKNSSMSLLTIWKPAPTATHTSPALAALL